VPHAAVGGRDRRGVELAHDLVQHVLPGDDPADGAPLVDDEDEALRSAWNRCSASTVSSLSGRWSEG
jgi:hypothetical protein